MTTAYEDQRTTEQQENRRVGERAGSTETGLGQHRCDAQGNGLYSPGHIRIKP